MEISQIIAFFLMVKELWPRPAGADLPRGVQHTAPRAAIELGKIAFAG
ncbi:MAG TPA: hypothetical protein VNI77_09730 [Nitrososphaera sp.]|nr:hypothetical protein [Nitrososphaera sp.]